MLCSVDTTTPPWLLAGGRRCAGLKGRRARQVATTHLAVDGQEVRHSEGTEAISHVQRAVEQGLRVREHAMSSFFSESIRLSGGGSEGGDHSGRQHSGASDSATYMKGVNSGGSASSCGSSDLLGCRVAAVLAGDHLVVRWGTPPPVCGEEWVMRFKLLSSARASSRAFTTSSSSNGVMALTWILQELSVDHSHALAVVAAAREAARGVVFLRHDPAPVREGLPAHHVRTCPDRRADTAAPAVGTSKGQELAICGRRAGTGTNRRRHISARACARAGRRRTCKSGPRTTRSEPPGT